MTTKIRNPNDLLALREKAKHDLELRNGGKAVQITVHMGTCGIASGARDVLSSLALELGSASVADVTLKQSGCAGLCEQEPMITLTDASGRQFRYGKLDKSKVREVVRQHLVGGSPVVDFMIKS